MLAGLKEQNKTLAFLPTGGSVRDVIANFDWASTSLGPIETWSSWFKSTLALVLRSEVPMVMLWGEDGYMIYNDGYAVFAGARHPQLLGSKVLEGWPEVASFNANILDVVLRRGEKISYRNQVLQLYRGTLQTTTWLDLDYSPIVDDEGKPVGVIAVVIEITDRVMAESWRNSERERQAQMFEQAPGFMAMMSGPQHVFELANAEYRKLVGHRDLIGRTVRDAFPDIAGQGFLELLDEVYSTGVPFVGSSIRAQLQGTPDAGKEDRFIDLIYQPILNPQGDVTGILAQGIDVTETLEAEKESRKSGERFRTLAEAMANHVWTAGPDGLLDWFNPRVYEYAGAFPGELDGADWLKIVHPDDIAGTLARWAESNKSLSLYENEFRLLRHDGAYRWHIARAVPILDAGGKLIQWIGTNTDIEDNKSVSEALQRSERRLALSQNAAGIGSLEIDIDTGIVIGSPQLWEIWGMPGREIVPSAELENLVLPEDRHLASTKESRAKGTTPPHAEYRIRRQSDGQVRWVSRSLDFLIEGGKPIKIFGIMQDITERKEAETRQRTLAHELEHRIKNILAMVSAIASRTLRDTDLESARKAFRVRLDALSTAHNILNETRWTEASLEEVIKRAVAPYDHERITLEGPPLAITPKMAISMALLVNELATNAVKYGALSNSSGRVEIKWDVQSEDGVKQISTWSWTEMGGPAVAAPQRKGFGSALIESVVGADFGGVFKLTYPPEGVKCLLVVPGNAGNQASGKTSRADPL